MTEKRYTQEDIDRAVESAVQGALVKKGWSKQQLDKRRADCERREQELDRRVAGLSEKMHISPDVLKYGLWGKPKEPGKADTPDVNDESPGEDTPNNPGGSHSSTGTSRARRVFGQVFRDEAVEQGQYVERTPGQPTEIRKKADPGFQEAVEKGPYYRRASEPEEQ